MGGGREGKTRDRKVEQETGKERSNYAGHEGKKCRMEKGMRKDQKKEDGGIKAQTECKQNFKENTNKKERKKK